jgi:hypothetical protein
MPQPQIPPVRHLQTFDRLGQLAIHGGAPENYRAKAEELACMWIQMLSQSEFLRIKYGMIDAERELESMAALRNDWDSYGANPPSADAVQASKSILSKLYEALIRPTTIVPSAEGGVSIYFVNGDRSAYVENYNDGSQALVMYDRQGSVQVLEIGTEIALAEVGARIAAYLD